MPNVLTKEDFIKELEKYAGKENLIHNFPNKTITIEETQKDGKGKIYLNISSYNDQTFFIKIDHKSHHTIGKKANLNDGIVLKVNLSTKEVLVLLFELKKQLRFKKLEHASKQLVSAYRFIKYLQLEECFEVEYKFYIGYKINNLKLDAVNLKTSNQYIFELFSAVYENKNKLPLMIPMCKFKEYNFEQLEFGEKISI